MGFIGDVTVVGDLKIKNKKGNSLFCIINQKASLKTRSMDE
jgi:hypothetical protein